MEFGTHRVLFRCTLINSLKFGASIIMSMLKSLLLLVILGRGLLVIIIRGIYRVDCRERCLVALSVGIIVLGCGLELVVKTYWIVLVNVG